MVAVGTDSAGSVVTIVWKYLVDKEGFSPLLAEVAYPAAARLAVGGAVILTPLIIFCMDSHQCNPQRGPRPSASVSQPFLAEKALDICVLKASFESIWLKYNEGRLDH